ncbi:iron ABC transporter substrate-binding protein [Alsobacter metallidurans]|uniref:Iron ABC transporter substrate-binding protein n=1 Tax=Alsobacter metallidurans TaxID=340221 RepID=A0A917IBM0_9HYPH|nr:ABC transporter substrate-binding protein [Alsobacter metallidurans]GGH31774.1 iron ABC transporter substrate-binding protein [Alsobacter metallidurans]
MKRWIGPLAGFIACGLLVPGASAQSKGEVVVYCSVLNEWCLAASQAFERKTGVKVILNVKGSGEVGAQLRAEASNPRADVWWGGTGDPHLAAAEADLTVAYKPAALGELHPWAVKQWEQSGGKTIGIYAGVLGFTWNTELIASKKLQAPKCWADLTRAEFRDEIQMSNPSSSGTAYTALATLIQVMGEDKAFGYLKGLHRNISQYTRSGPAPVRNAARAETMIGIIFLHDAVAEANEGFPLATAAPCEGTGYEIGSMSLVKGGRNPDNAKLWYEWSLSAEAQSLAKENKSFQVPSNRSAAAHPKAPRLEDIKLVDYDFAKYGSSEERKRIVSRWEQEVGMLPK